MSLVLLAPNWAVGISAGGCAWIQVAGIYLFVAYYATLWSRPRLLDRVHVASE